VVEVEILFQCLVSFCRHVVLPKEISRLVPKSHLMSESEWRSIGVQQSQGWIHYMKHDPGKQHAYIVHGTHEHV